MDVAFCMQVEVTCITSKKRGNVKYLKCHIISCDESAKIQGDEFIAGVSIIMIVMVVALCEDIYY